MDNLPVVKEGLPFAIVFLIIGIVTYHFSPLFSLLPFILFVFVLFFFRNPRRNIPSEEGIIVSPADGTILSIDEVYEDKFLKQEGVKVSIFLSIFNVHINRSPISGRIRYRSYTKGQFLPAYHERASQLNERNFVGIENDRIKIMVVQIAGLIARRIVCWVNEGEHVRQGDRFGLIKFGSCTEIIVPKSVEIFVKKGEKVKGGETIIGRLR